MGTVRYGTVQDDDGTGGTDKKDSCTDEVVSTRFDGRSKKTVSLMYGLTMVDGGGVCSVCLSDLSVAWQSLASQLFRRCPVLMVLTIDNLVLTVWSVGRSDGRVSDVWSG